MPVRVSNRRLRLWVRLQILITLNPGATRGFCLSIANFLVATSTSSTIAAIVTRLWMRASA